MNAGRELRIQQDWVETAAALFLQTAPRTIALSGGSTPRALYERLATIPYPWSQVDAFFGDERCVAPDDPDSNFRMASEALLSRVAARVHPMTGCDPVAYEHVLEQVLGAGIPSLDLMFLGLGADGHTASLFPGDPALEERERAVLLVDRPDHRRMTLTLPVLSATRTAIFLVVGEAKRPALRRLLAGEDDVPAARVHATRVLIVADPAAAAGLGRT
ncbi:MAG TPA: 6-phosphogluconolactonase [Actinomycetota bacterium]